MDSTRGQRLEAALALIITVVVHAALVWGLSRAMRPVLPPPVDKPLQIVWVPRHKAPAKAVEPIVRPERVNNPARTRRTPAVSAKAPAIVTTETPQATPESARPMSAVYLMQARDQLGAASVQAADPLADRVAALPGAGAGRFRMKPPPTGVAGVVASVGKLFGAEDAGAPCRENRRNIGELAAAGDSAALQQQLEFEKRLCRP
ncbi:hypothetical protein HIV01_011910 [Lysobacter arenosi]|uniref:Energy transducer TonB n=1 Tax=Lysobacter arenosi TaxID=2795387 RepID=A0ABX7R723_9GAMM|nr:hypothetical protein [Lysobacter arenosi]QSX73927.1 hypothetical protein HIV01_011910 [Lysobacter arenosi]